MESQAKPKTNLKYDIKIRLITLKMSRAQSIIDIDTYPEQEVLIVSFHIPAAWKTTRCTLLFFHEF